MEQCRGLDRLAGSGAVSTLLVLLGLQKLPQLFTIWVKDWEDGWLEDAGKCQRSKVLAGN